MAELDAIGIVELSSIAIGFKVQDVMLKAARVELLVARTICSGKYLVAVAGDVASATAAVDAAVQEAEGFLIESRVISRVHPSVFPAIAGNVELKAGQEGALGVVETFSATSIIDCADAAAKAAKVVLLRVHLAMAIGGKGFVLVSGDIANVRAAVEASSKLAAAEGILVASSIIARPSPELFREWI
ncbi:MAG TPA: BMC domain-containing protein [Acidobacteriota bacterium]|jgi:microcompartment protein CcmL/EutN|nr:BMC domain-containing protein [Acidobacteriota bacterium]